jgi:flagellar protein FliO/FliZ
LRSIFGTDIPQGVQWLLALLLVLGLVVLFGVLLRRFAGGRLRVKGQSGRARQPRLGIVDIYDLDRQRQLVLLRRDNVEHLVMIGGPNDVVIEQTISRAGQRVPLQPIVVEPESDQAQEPQMPTEVTKPADPVPPAAQSRPPEPAPRLPIAPAVTAATAATVVAAQAQSQAVAPAVVTPLVLEPTIEIEPQRSPPEPPVFETLVQRTQITAPPVERPITADRTSAPDMSEAEIDAVARELESALLSMAPAASTPKSETPDAGTAKPASPLPPPATVVAPAGAEIPTAVAQKAVDVNIDELKSATARVVEPKITESRASEPKSTAPKAIEPKSTEPKSIESKPAGAMTPEVAAPEVKAPEAKAPEAKAPDAQSAGARSQQPKPQDPKPEAAQAPATARAAKSAQVEPDMPVTEKAAEPPAESIAANEPGTPDPFSVDAIEAEFARLLNRTAKPKG